jgi:hypothetical protein
MPPWAAGLLAGLTTAGIVVSAIVFAAFLAFWQPRP